MDRDRVATTQAEIAGLERSGQFEQAAELAEVAGLHGDAARLWERACDFGRAARAALAAELPSQALLLAARARAADLEQRAREQLMLTPDVARQAAARADRAGQSEAAARVWLAIGDMEAAARSFERAGRVLEAASAHLGAGQLHRAAECLTRALDLDPEAHAVRLELGRLLLAADRTEHAVRELQRIAPQAPERGQALLLLRDAMARLGFAGAGDEVERELEKLGLQDSATPPLAVVSAEGETGDVLFGRYRVLRVIATTPTARVYEAFDRVRAESVAVKLFSGAALRDVGRDAMRRFEREARALGQLRHPAIVPLLDYVPSGPAVILRYMEGGSLADLLSRGPLAPARAVEITARVLSALSEAHRRGILHRDIKPANVLFDDAGAAHLSDFGVSHIADSAATVTSGVIGTLAYMAPEQRAGAPATVSSDIYGAGALLWHALTGAPPGADLPFISQELDERQRALAERLIAGPDRRPRDCVEARTELLSLDWPRQAPAARETRAADSVKPEASARLEPRGGPLHYDRLLERAIWVLAADPPVVERASAYARADHPLLACVLAYRPEEGTIWIDAVEGNSLSRPLDQLESARLGEALGALHRAGGSHGSVDRDHVVERNGSIILRFALEPLHPSADADLEGLRRLGVAK